MKTKSCVIMIGLFLIMSVGCETLQTAMLNLNKPTASLKGLRFENATLDTANLLFDIEVDNPYSIDLPMTNLDYGLTTNGKSFLNGKAGLQAMVPANSKKTFSLPAKINYLEMFKALKGIKPGSNIPYEAELGLSVDAPAIGEMRLPLKKQGEITLPTVDAAGIKKIWDVIK